jgi:hypothetical protein
MRVTSPLSQKLNSTAGRALLIILAALVTVGYTQPASASPSKRAAAIATRAALGKWGGRVAAPRSAAASCKRIRRGSYRCAVRVAGADATVLGTARVRIRGRSVRLSYKRRVNASLPPSKVAPIKPPANGGPPAGAVTWWPVLRAAEAAVQARFPDCSVQVSSGYPEGDLRGRHFEWTFSADNLGHCTAPGRGTVLVVVSKTGQIATDVRVTPPMQTQFAVELYVQQLAREHYDASDATAWCGTGTMQEMNGKSFTCTWTAFGKDGFYKGDASGSVSSTGDIDATLGEGTFATYPPSSGSSDCWVGGYWVSGGYVGGVYVPGWWAPGFSVC